MAEDRPNQKSQGAADKAEEGGHAGKAQQAKGEGDKGEKPKSRERSRTMSRA